MPKSSTLRSTPTSLSSREDVGGAHGVVHQGGLGELEAQPGGVEAGGVQHGGDLARRSRGRAAASPDTLTATRSRCPARFQAAVWRQACSSTNWPMGPIRPASSATGMNVSR